MTQKNYSGTHMGGLYVGVPCFDPTRAVERLDEIRSALSDLALAADSWDAAPAAALRDAKDALAAVQDLIETLSLNRGERTGG